MAIIKCKMCGGDLKLIEGASTAECEFCGSIQTIPKADDEKKLTLFARANRLRIACEFDKAAGVYESIVADFSEEAEAYWGLVLCKYGIEYVDDPATGKKIPTCHRSSFDSVMEDSDFEQTLENADPMARRVYREEARQIEEIRKGIIAVSANEEPYDIFICYKESDTNGDRTLDSVLAQDLYDALTDKGYRVFFSRITLEDKLGAEYEPYIFAALNSAKVMLAVGTDYEHYNAVWVKNEWSRYLKLMEADKSRHLIPCYKGIDAYDMPKEFARLQAQDLGKMGAVQDILRNMEKLIPRSAPQHQPQMQQPQQSSRLNDNVSDMLSRAYAAMKNKEWEMADTLFEAVMKSPMNTSERVLIEQNVRQSREQVSFQLRRIRAKKHNRIMALVLAGVCGILMLLCCNHMENFLYEGFAVSGNEDSMTTAVLRGVNLLGIVPVFLVSLLGITFVADTPGRRSFWVGASRVLSIIGVFTSVTVIVMLYTSGELSNVEYEYYALVRALESWLKTVDFLHLSTFVLMFFRKKT